MKKKILITSPHNIGEFESWLSDLAWEGLYLDHLGKVFGYFESGDPCAMEYRVELTKDTTDEQQDLYLQYGWKQVTKKGNVIIYCCKSDEVKEEIHTDPLIHAYVLQKEIKKIAGLFVISLLGLLVNLPLILDIMFVDGVPILNLVEDGLQMAFSLFGTVLLSIIAIKEYRDISKTYKTLKTGNPISHHTSWKTCQIYSNILLVLTIPFVMITLSNAYFSFLNIRYSLTNEKCGMIDTRDYILSLSDFEEYVGDLEEPIDGGEYSCSVRKHTNFFSKEIYDISEDIGSLLGSTSLHTAYYNLKFSFLSKYVMADLIKLDMEFYDSMHDEIDLQKLNIENVDEAYYFSEEYCVTCYIRQSSKVIKIKYYGEKNVNDIIKILEKTM